MRNHYIWASLIVSALAASVAGCTNDDDDVVIVPAPVPGASLVFVNESDFTIDQIYLAAVDDPSYGPNLLGSDVLLPGDELVLDVACDFYDVLLIDEFGAECELFDLDLCLNDATFVIGNNTCVAFGR